MLAIARCRKRGAVDRPEDWSVDSAGDRIGQDERTSGHNISLKSRAGGSPCEPPDPASAADVGFERKGPTPVSGDCCGQVGVDVQVHDVLLSSETTVRF